MPSPLAKSYKNYSHVKRNDITYARLHLFECVPLQQKMQQLDIERRVEVLQEAKKEMACKVAELSQLKAARGDLEHRFLDLNATIKQLKTKQYELSQQNVNAHCEQLQAKKMREQCEEQIRLGRAVGQEIQIDLAQQKDKIQQLQTEKERSIKQKHSLEKKIYDKASHIEAVKQQIAEVQLNVQNLKKVECSRLEIVAKIKQSHEYYASKAKQIQKSKENTTKLHQEQTRRGRQLQDTIKHHEMQLEGILLRKEGQQRGIANESQKIDSQKLKKKVLLQKLQILQQRLASVQDGQLYSQQLLAIKQKTAREAQQKVKTRRSAWVAIRDRMAIELEYAHYYCQRLGY